MSAKKPIPIQATDVVIRRTRTRANLTPRVVAPPQKKRTFGHWTAKSIPLLTSFKKKRSWQFVGIAVVAFLLANVEVYLIHQGRTFPNTTVAGQHLGAVANGAIASKITDMPLLPKEISLTDGKTTTKIATASLDIKQDSTFTAQKAQHTHSWLPIIGLFTNHDVPLQLIANNTKLQAAIQNALPSTDQQPIDAKMTKLDASFSIKAAVVGKKLNIAATSAKLLEDIENGKTTTQAVVDSVQPKVTSQSLQPKLTAIQQQVKTSVTLQYEGKTKKFSAAEMAALYAEEGEGSKDDAGVVLSDIAIQNSVITAGSGFGIGVQNLSDAITAVKSAVTNQKPLTFTLKAKPFGKTYTYCTSTRGVDSSALSELSAILKKAYTDSRGWNLGGQVKFESGTSGCDFTVWLSAADQMTTFGDICDAGWSCEVTPNIVINYDRWRYTTDPWKKYGGSLEEYRIMAVNHETGHWLGFYHDVCHGAGQPAPVMEQQSIDLQGCVFNPWPTPNEQGVLKARLGL
jgi:hypothetical protein